MMRPPDRARHHVLRVRTALVLLSLLGFSLGLITPALAQLNEDCTANILNRRIQVNPDGTFLIGNVPVTTGAFRVRIVCEQEWLTGNVL